MKIVNKGKEYRIVKTEFWNENGRYFSYSVWDKDNKDLIPLADFLKMEG